MTWLRWALSQIWITRAEMEIARQGVEVEIARARELAHEARRLAESSPCQVATVAEIIRRGCNLPARRR